MEVEARKDIKEFAKLIPRPLGTEEASFEDRKWDYDNRGPDYWGQMYALTYKEVVTSGGSWGDIREILYKHEIEMKGED